MAATLVSSQAYSYHCHLSKRTLNQAKEPYSPLRFSRHNHIERRDFSLKNTRFLILTITRKQKPLSFNTVCFAADEPSEISADARIRSEVLSPFRSVRMFFYLAFIASASLGGLIATSRLIGALANPARSGEVLEIVKGLGIDIGAASLFAFLYFRENKTKNAQMARLSREENLAKLRMRVEENNKVISVGDLRGIARLVICAGPADYIEEAFKRSREFTQGLVERGVVVVAYATDGKSPVLEFDETDDNADEEMSQRRRRLWRVAPVFVSEWEKWLDEQKKLAGVSSDSPVYLSLRLDGRVRGSGVGYPPWQAFVAQLPPVKGIWTGLLDGMDGRV
uniref:Protein LOW PSII ACCUMULATION 1, chloroplastic n=1 Tax=Noccaea caerulescens TaxID=107243 RepID=A0A1J3J8R6_NOCCA